MNTPTTNQLNLEDNQTISAFEPRKIWLMKCNMKKTGFKDQALKFLVVADNYETAKKISDEFAAKGSDPKTYVSNITGSEIKHDYMLMIEETKPEAHD